MNIFGLGFINFPARAGKLGIWAGPDENGPGLVLGTTLITVLITIFINVLITVFITELITLLITLRITAFSSVLLNTT